MPEPKARARTHSEATEAAGIARNPCLDGFGSSQGFSLYSAQAELDFLNGPLGGRTPILVSDLGREKYHLKFVTHEVVERVPNRSDCFFPCLTLCGADRKEDDAVNHADGKRGQRSCLPWSNISEEREEDRDHRNAGDRENEFQVFQEPLHLPQV